MVRACLNDLPRNWFSLHPGRAACVCQLFVLTSCVLIMDTQHPCNHYLQVNAILRYSSAGQRLWEKLEVYLFL